MKNNELKETCFFSGCYSQALTLRRGFDLRTFSFLKRMAELIKWWYDPKIIKTINVGRFEVYDKKGNLLKSIGDPTTEKFGLFTYEYIDEGKLKLSVYESELEKYYQNFFIQAKFKDNEIYKDLQIQLKEQIEFNKDCCIRDNGFKEFNALIGIGSNQYID